MLLQVYFSPEWASLLETSFRNYLSGVMHCLPLPAVLRFNTDRRLRQALQQQVREAGETISMITRNQMIYRITPPKYILKFIGYSSKKNFLS